MVYCVAYLGLELVDVRVVHDACELRCGSGCVKLSRTVNKAGKWRLTVARVGTSVNVSRPHTHRTLIPHRESTGMTRNTVRDGVSSDAAWTGDRHRARGFATPALINTRESAPLALGAPSRVPHFPSLAGARRAGRRERLLHRSSKALAPVLSQSPAF